MVNYKVKLQKGKTFSIYFISVRPNSLKLGSKFTLDNEPLAEVVTGGVPDDDEDFYTRQSRLQMQARVALSQAKDMARMEMEVSQLLLIFPSLAAVSPPPDVVLIFPDGTPTAETIANYGTNSE